MARSIKPGSRDQEPGLYHEVDNNGNPIPNGRVTNLRAGCELPPTHRGSAWAKSEEK